MHHELVVEDDAAAVATAGARFVADRALAAVDAHGSFTMAFSGGKTPWLMFAELANLDLPWDKIVLYQVDERCAPADDPDRNLAHLLAALGGDRPGSLEAMPVEDDDLETAADRYAARLPERFDLIHLGIGPDGHTASLVPGDTVLNETEHLVWPTGGEYQGRRRMTLTYLALARADELLWLVSGDEKADALGKLLAGDRSIPAGRIEGAPRSTVIADPAAANRPAT